MTEPLDNTPEGQLIRFVRGYAAKVEPEKIRERSLRGKRARIQAGKIHNHGPELYGYRRDKAAGIRSVYEPEAAIVREVFTWVLEGHGLRAILQRLNGQGIRSPGVGVSGERLPPSVGQGATAPAAEASGLTRAVNCLALSPHRPSAAIQRVDCASEIGAGAGICITGCVGRSADSARPQSGRRWA